MLLIERSVNENLRPQGMKSYDDFLAIIKQICNIDGRYSPLEASYGYIGPIDVGAQAAVDVYTELTTNGKSKNKLRAVKTYKKPPPGIDLNNPVFADYAEAQFQEWQV